MNRVGVAALAAVLVAAVRPAMGQVVPPTMTQVGISAAHAMAVQCPDGTTTCFGSSTPQSPVVGPGNTQALIDTLVTTSQPVLPALSTRHGWHLANSSAADDQTGYAYCTDDGSAPTKTHWVIIVYGQGDAANLPGVPVSPLVIQCLGGGAPDVKISAEQW